MKNPFRKALPDFGAARPRPPMPSGAKLRTPVVWPPESDAPPGTILAKIQAKIAWHWEEIEKLTEVAASGEPWLAMDVENAKAHPGFDRALLNRVKV